MTDVLIGSASWAQIQHGDDGPAAAPPSAPGSEQQQLDALLYGQNDNYGIGAPILTYLPEAKEAEQPIDLGRIIAEAQQQRGEDVRTAALNAAAQLAASTFVPANAGAAQLAASALTELAASYNETTAAQLDPALAYWTNIAQQQLAAGSSVAAPSSPFAGVGDANATGQETVAGQAMTGAQYLQDKAIVFVTRTVEEVTFRDVGESSYAVTNQVQRPFAVTIGEAMRELNLDAAQAAAYLEQNGVYVIRNDVAGTRAEFEAVHGRAPTAAERAYVVRPETMMRSGENEVVMPTVYGTAQQHLQAAGHDLGVYAWLPAHVMAAARANPNGNVLLASSDQVTTVQAHLAEQALGTYLLPDGNAGTRADFETATGRVATDADRAFIVRGPVHERNGENENTYPATLGNQAAYLQAIGLSPSAPGNLTIAFNNSRARGGDAYLDTSHRSIDMTQPNALPERAYRAVANDALAAEWVQIGANGPINDDVAKILGDVYARFGADTPEKQEIVRGQLFRYDPSYGVIANRELIKGAVEMNDNRRQGFFERGFGRALLTVAATVVGGPVLAAGVSAAFAAYDGGSLGDIAVAGAAAYAGGVVGAGVGGAVTSSLASSGVSATASAAAGGFAQGVASSATSQLITTGSIDGDRLLQAGVTGGVTAGVTTGLNGTDLVNNIDTSLGLAPGTAARVIGAQAGTVAGTGGFDWEGALATLVAQPASIRTGTPTESANADVNEVARMYEVLAGNPDLTVEIDRTQSGVDVIDAWSRDGERMTFTFVNGVLTGRETNRDLVDSGVGARMQQVNAMADELAANPALRVITTSDYRTGEQQLTILSPDQPTVQYNYINGEFHRVTFPDQENQLRREIDVAFEGYGVPTLAARLWSDRALAGESLISRDIDPALANMGKLVTVAMNVSEPGKKPEYTGSGALGVATIDGVDRIVLSTGNHVLDPVEGTVFSARDSLGRLVEIPLDGQIIRSRGVIGDNGRMTLDNTNDWGRTDGYMVTLSPETLNALRPGTTLADLPRVGAPPPRDAPIAQFGFAGWGNVDNDGQYIGVNLVGAAGTALDHGDGLFMTSMAVSTTNPPVTGGMSGGPVLVKLPDGTIQLVGVLAKAGTRDSSNAFANLQNGTNLPSHLSFFADLSWVVNGGSSGEGP